jgi:hypothetical protein
MSDGPEWFAPKRYGYGTGLPISWQGWVVLIGYIGLVGICAYGLRGHSLQVIAAVIPLTLAFIVICARTTKDGWRWRWGEKD